MVLAAAAVAAAAAVCPLSMPSTEFTRPSFGMSFRHSAGSSIPPSLLTSLEESIALLNSHTQPPAASTESISATIRSIHSLLRTSAPSTHFSASLPQQFSSAYTLLFHSLLSTQQYEQAVGLLVLLPADSTVSTIAFAADRFESSSHPRHRQLFFPLPPHHPPHHSPTRH